MSAHGSGTGKPLGVVEISPVKPPTYFQRRLHKIMHTDVHVHAPSISLGGAGFVPSRPRAFSKHKLCLRAVQNALP